MKTMTKKKDSILFKKEKKGTFYIVRDENFAHLMAMSFSFHSKYMEAVSKEKGQVVQESQKFLNLMERLSVTENKINISLSDIRLLNEWVKCITEVIIESSSVDLKEKNMLKFFRLSQDFVSKTSDVI